MPRQAFTVRPFSILRTALTNSAVEKMHSVTNLKLYKSVVYALASDLRVGRMDISVPAISVRFHFRHGFWYPLHLAESQELFFRVWGKNTKVEYQIPLSI